MKMRILPCLLLALITCSHGFGQASIIAPIATGALASVLTRGSTSDAVRYGVPAAAAIVGYEAGKAYDQHEQSKEQREKFHAYQMGLWQDAWVRANTDWYYATLDRKTGLPPAFDGYWAMFIGLPTVEKDLLAKKQMLPPQSVPGSREAYLDYLLAATQQQQSGSSPAELVDIPTVKGTIPRHQQNGVDYEPQTRDFPELP